MTICFIVFQTNSVSIFCNFLWRSNCFFYAKLEMGLTALEVLFFMRNEMHMEKAIWKRNRYNERIGGWVGIGSRQLLAWLKSWKHRYYKLLNFLKLWAAALTLQGIDVKCEFYIWSLLSKYPYRQNVKCLFLQLISF